MQESDHDIFHLIYEAKDFKIWIDSNLDLDWETTEKYDDENKDNIKEQNEILNMAATLECIPNDHHSKSIRLNFKRMIGEGIARAFKHDYKNAKLILNNAKQYIDNRNIEKARCWQLWTSYIASFIFGIIGLTIWSFRSQLINSWGATAFFMCLAFISGTIGAFLSIILRMGRTRITSEAEKSLHIIEGICHVLSGGISGFFVAGLVKIGLIAPLLKTDQHINLAMIITSLIFGASERLAPSLISNFGKNLLDKSQESQEDK